MVREEAPMSMTDSERTRAALHLLAGGMLALVSALADALLGQVRHWGPGERMGLVLGLGLMAIGLVPRHTAAISRVSTRLCLSWLSLLTFLAAGEAVCRMAGLDFSLEERAWRRVPPFYRQPTVPTGEVFFRRPGPERWTGRVLHTVLKQRGIVPNPYADEPVVTVEYNREGFRNPDPPPDWTIAVAGDSFTELGYLPQEQMFTSVMARELGTAVLNLGVSYTGPLTQLSYLADYGTAPGMRQAVIVFFEGNDLKDLAEEHRARVRWQRTGRRGYREFERQPSFVRALHEIAGAALGGPRRRGGSNPLTAYFRSSEGITPVTFNYAPPGRTDLSAETLRQIDDFFRQYADWGRRRQVTAWLAYVPCKRRVLHGRVRFTAGAAGALRDWQPTDLPDVMSESCHRHGIGFIDLTPALIRFTLEERQLPYNAIYDSHFTPRGSWIVGRELARRLSAPPSAHDP